MAHTFKPVTSQVMYEVASYLNGCIGNDIIDYEVVNDNVIMVKGCIDKDDVGDMVNALGFNVLFID